MKYARALYESWYVHTLAFIRLIVFAASFKIVENHTLRTYTLYPRKYDDKNCNPYIRSLVFTCLVTLKESLIILFGKDFNII